MVWGITVPTCSSASDGVVSFVAFFTDGRFQTSTFNTNDRSKISLYFLSLCGIISNVGIFKFDCVFCFMSSHLTMVENPCADFSYASTWICENLSSSNDDEWGPLVTDASISYGFQSCPTKTGHPTCAYCSNKFAAGCCLALHLGNMRPRNFP